ncbi:MAG: hypothetical protein AAB617_03180 [Patescibacteria group bacterium]
MAIIVEQEKKSVNWVAVISTTIIIAVLFLGSYFVFFKKPELIEVVAPSSLESLSNISKLSFDAESVLGSPTFKLLRQYELQVAPGTPGRSNPFRPF